MATLLLEAGVVFAVLAAGGALAARLDQSVIPAYILAGALLGPNAPIPAMRVVAHREFVDLLAELGIVLLLFFIGLEFNLGSLLARRDRVVRAGVADVVGNGAVGFVLGLAFGFATVEALVLAGVVAISSSAVITKSLVDLGWVADPESEAVLSLLVVEDVVIAVYLAVLAALVGGGSLLALVSSLGVVAALVALALFGTPVLERLLRTGSDELFVLRVFAAIVVVGGVAFALGVSEAVAAFFLGAAVGTTDHAERVERVVTSDRDLFAAVFFLAIGLQTDLLAIPGVAVSLTILVVVTAAAKFLTGVYGGLAWGLSDRRAGRVGVSMVARGEFSLVLAALAVDAGLDPALSTLAVGYVLAASVLGTVLMRNAGPFERLTESLLGRATDRP